MRSDDSPRFSKRFLFWIAVLIILMLVIAIFGISYRMIELRKLRQTANQLAILNVEVIRAEVGPPSQEIVLPGSVTAWHDATLFARVSGFIYQWKVDIGYVAKAGDLLAEISAPDIDAQFRQAEADLQTAIANYEIAHITNVRWWNLLKTHSVSLQDAEQKMSTEKADAAIVNSTRANRDRLLDLVSFKKIIAPFDGVIMSRNTDIGNLINAGSGPVPIFQIVQSDRLRIYVQVPQYFSNYIVPNMKVSLTFAEHPGKTYTAQLLNTAQAIDPNNRTLLTQFVMRNPRYELYAGGYTQVHLTLPTNKNYVRLPVNTLIFRSQGLQVAAIDGDSKALLKSITIGRDFGDYVEVIAGLTPGERIIINPPDALFNGQQVHIVSPKPKTNQAAKTSKATKTKSNKTP